jgi:predicted glycosyltransferase involved in capsule biosynthesis
MELNSKYISLKKPKVAIIVPFRDLENGERTKQLNIFIPYMTNFMKKFENEVIKWKIFLAEQSNDGLKFNRGRILNYAAIIAISQGFDTLIFHDVDLIPSYQLAKWYISKPVKKIVYNIGGCWTERFEEFNKNNKINVNSTGGIASIRSDDFIRVDGFPNIYWGWGGEDLELTHRLLEINVKFISPEGKGLIKDLEEYITYKQKKEKLFNVKKNIKCSILWELKKIHKNIRKDKIVKPAWWGMKNININKNNVINITNTENFQHFIIDLGLTENIIINLENEKEKLYIPLNTTALHNFYIY